MAAMIQKIGRLAINIFKREVGGECADISLVDLEELKKLVSAVSVRDLNIDPTLLQNMGPYNPKLDSSAPVTYMQIYEDADVNICVFILKNGVKLPLHDHPEMHGLLKVIHGSVSIQSYSMTEKNSNSNIFGDRNRLSCIQQAVKHPCLQMSAQDAACILLPAKNNLHEISTVDGPAAFLDILSPPYGTDKRKGIERDCHYFQEIKINIDSTIDDKTAWLLNIPTPREFWCHQAEYCGPPVNDKRKSSS